MDRPRIFLSFFLGILTLQLQVSALNPEADNGYEEWASQRNYSEFQRQSDGLRAAGDYRADLLSKPLANCNNNYISYAVNYIGTNTVIKKKNPIYEGCYDLLSQSAKWSRGKLVPKKETFVRNTYFSADSSWMGITRIDMDNFYSLENEKSSFESRFPNLIGQSFLFTSSCAALVRGHLTPYADMSTEIDAEATNRFINVAPQWSELNSGNWLKVENNIRKWNTDLNKDLNTSTPPPKSPTTPPPKPPISFTITTGTSTSILFDGYSNKPFYLGNTQNKDIIQVPLFFWKLICYQDNQQKKNEMFIFGINFLFDAKLLSPLLFSNPKKRPANGLSYDLVKTIVCSAPIGYTANSNPFILPATANDPLRGIVFGCLKTNIVDPEIKNHGCL